MNEMVEVRALADLTLGGTCLMRGEGASPVRRSSKTPMPPSFTAEVAYLGLLPI
jgi:hypothetical protein